MDFVYTTLTPSFSLRHIFMNQISHCGTSSLQRNKIRTLVLMMYVRYCMYELVNGTLFFKMIYKELFLKHNKNINLFSDTWLFHDDSVCWIVICHPELIFVWHYPISQNIRYLCNSYGMIILCQQCTPSYLNHLQTCMYVSWCNSYVCHPMK